MTDGPAGRVPRYVFLCDGRPGDDPPGHYGWRLVAANHRPLGRGRWAAESLVECRTAAHLIHREAARLRPALTSLDGVWSWQLALDEVALAVCVHGYARRVECARGLTQFLAAADVADPDNGVVRHFGPHSLRGYLVDRAPHQRAPASAAHGHVPDSPDMTPSLEYAHSDSEAPSVVKSSVTRRQPAAS